MLLLLINLGKTRYGIDASQVVEVVPVVELRRIPHAPEFVAGLFQYRGDVVPVIDLQQLTSQQPCSVRLSTRIVVIRYAPASGATHLLGLMAERVTEAIHVTPDQFKASGVTISAAPYLGSLAVKQQEMIQCLDLNRLLPPALQDTLYRR